jgi:RNA polymerase sigma-70 factor (ECF subfamily)
VSSDASDTDRLLRLLHDGDEQALARLFSRYREKLRKMVLFRLDPRLRGRVDSSDVLQDVYLDAAQRLHHYRKSPAVSLLVWLRQITEQRLVDLHRRHFGARMRDARREAPQAGAQAAADDSRSAAASLMNHLAQRHESPSEEAIRQEFAGAIQSALDGLEPLDREVLALRHFEELTNNEVADVLGISKTAASNRYVRALERLRRLMENDPGFDPESS